jgi:nucleotide-binding universal stress UspA family protein
MTILIAYDGSSNADAAISAAAKLMPPDASVVVLSVWEPLVVQALHAAKFGALTPPFPSDVADDDQHSAHAARRLAEHGARLAGEAGFDARALWAADERTIADALIEAADELDASLIVMGSRGLTGIRAFMGSVSTHVLQHSHRPALIVPPSAEVQATEPAQAEAATTS